MNLIWNVLWYKRNERELFSFVESHKGLSPESFLVIEVPEDKEEYQISISHLLIESDLDHSLLIESDFEHSLLSKE